MAKQIYIDSNGNEVLVSGTITDAGNLPLGTDFTDPTSTAYAVKALQDGKAEIKIDSGSGTTSANGNIGVTRTGKFIIIGAWCNVVNGCVIPFIDYSSASTQGSTAWYLHFMNGNSSQTSINSTTVTYYYAYIEVT